MEATTACPAVTAPSAIRRSLVENVASEVDFPVRPQLADPSTVTSPQQIMANRGLRDTLRARQEPRYGPDTYSDSIRVALNRGPSVVSEA